MPKNRLKILELGENRIKFQIGAVHALRFKNKKSASYTITVPAGWVEKYWKKKLQGTVTIEIDSYEDVPELQVDKGSE